MKLRYKSLTLCALVCAFLCVCAQITVPMPSGIAITLQTFAAALAGFLLGAKLGGVCGAVYIMLGAIGLPVFSGLSAGPSHLVGLSGGFLWALPAFCALCGATVYVNRAPTKIILCLIALLLLHLCGVLWFSHVSGNPIFQSFLMASLVYLLKDALFIAAAYLLSKRVKRYF